MSLEFNLPKFFQDQGINWDTAQSLLGWPAGQRRHALQRFVEGGGRLSRSEVNDLLRFVYEHCPTWLDYIAPPNILQLLSDTGRVRLYIVGGTSADALSDHSSLFDLLALACINANLPRTAWRPVCFDIEPCRMAWVSGTDERVPSSIGIHHPPEWKVSFGSSKVSRATTVILEQIYGKEKARPPAAEPVVFRLRPPEARPFAETRFVEWVADESQQGISIGGGRPFLYQPLLSRGPDSTGKDVGLIVCQADANGGGRVVIAGVSGPGTYAAALAFVQCADLFAPRRISPASNIRASLARYSADPTVGVVEAVVGRESADSPSRVVRSARLVHCSNRPEVSLDQPLDLQVPGQAGPDAPPA